jgi:hypothetical protein
MSILDPRLFDLGADAPSTGGLLGHLAPIAHHERAGAFGPLVQWLGDNSTTLLGLGAGLAGGRNWGEGLGQGFKLAMGGRALDQQRAAQGRTVAALIKLGLDADSARAAAGNPVLLRAIMAQRSRP